MRRGRDRTAIILREIDIIATSQHPNIVKYIGSFEVGLELWVGLWLWRSDWFQVVMEYVHGGNLYDYLKLGEERGLFFTEAQVSYIIHEAVKAIKFLHSLDRIHRDIKVKKQLRIHSHNRWTTFLYPLPVTWSWQTLVQPSSCPKNDSKEQRYAELLIIWLRSLLTELRMTLR